ncbi:MAG: hypothetical protein GVY22_14955 [Gammaproteobacteria bacterium]|nr:hypothetical protein [Gammaproteobacteria bacterium]
MAAFPEDAQRAAVLDAKILDKPTLKARKLTSEHLCRLYALDPQICLFRVLRRLWPGARVDRDQMAQQSVSRRDRDVAAGLEMGAFARAPVSSSRGS